MRFAESDRAFRSFSDAVTGYRLSSVLLTIARNGLIDALGPAGATEAAVADEMGWDMDATRRFLACLERLGLLRVLKGVYQTTPFSRRFFESGGAGSQTRAMAFEERQVETWGTLEAVLRAGGRVKGIEDKAADQCRADLRAFLGAMDDAARVRAKELWDLVDPPDDGVIVDVGGGSGAYLSEFLGRHARWRGIFCDLDDVVAAAREGTSLAQVAKRISFVETNYLDEDFCLPAAGEAGADIVLLSNVVHCQSAAESRRLLKRVVSDLPEDGLLVVHDLFADTNWQGALYDLHMLVNTYNGEVWTAEALEAVLREMGLGHTVVVELPSQSVALFAARSAGFLPVLAGRAQHGP